MNEAVRNRKKLSEKETFKLRSKNGSSHAGWWGRWEQEEETFPDRENSRYKDPEVRTRLALREWRRPTCWKHVLGSGWSKVWKHGHGRSVVKTIFWFSFYFLYWSIVDFVLVSVIHMQNQRSNCQYLLNHWKSKSSRKTSTSALLTMPKPLTVWITTNGGKFFKRWEYQTTLPVSWETYIQVKMQQLELDMEQTVSRLGKKYVKAAYYHPAC